MIAGSTGNGKTSFIESLIGTPIVFDNHSVFASFQDADELAIFEIYCNGEEGCYRFFGLE